MFPGPWDLESTGLPCRAPNRLSTIDRIVSASPAWSGHGETSDHVPPGSSLMWDPTFIGAGLSNFSASMHFVMSTCIEKCNYYHSGTDVRRGTTVPLLSARSLYGVRRSELIGGRASWGSKVFGKTPGIRGEPFCSQHIMSLLAIIVRRVFKMH